MHMHRGKSYKLDRLLMKISYGVYSYGIISASEDAMLKIKVFTKESLTLQCSC